MERKTIFYRKSCPGTEGAIWSVSKLPVPGGIRAEVGNPSTHPAPRLRGEFLHWDAHREATWAKRGCCSSPKSHGSLIHSLSTRSPRPALARLGTRSSIREKPPLSAFRNPIQGRGWGRTGHRGWRRWLPTLHVTDLYRPPSQRASTGPWAGQGQAQCNLLLHPPLPEVPEALGSFPNEVSGRALPN